MDTSDAREMYFSADAEADGPVPGPYSMLSFGLAVAGTYDGETFAPRDPGRDTFYAGLRPISDRVDQAALAVSGLDRGRLAREGQEPRQAMNAAAGWIRRVAADAVPVFAGYPACYDWMWLHWYFVQFADGGSPFGHSRCLDLKTFYAARFRAPIVRSTKKHMPPQLLADRPHTHHALDDAIEQAELCQNLFRHNQAYSRP